MILHLDPGGFNQPVDIPTIALLLLLKGFVIGTLAISFNWGSGLEIGVI